MQNLGQIMPRECEVVSYPPLEGSETSEARSWVDAKRRGGVTVSPRERFPS
jgi:hypothetical protein